MAKDGSSFKYPGIPKAMDGTDAAVAMETAGSEAGGVYPITPASNMGEGFAAASAAGVPNVFGRRLIFFEPEGEHAAAAVTAGMAMTGLRATNFSSGQGIAYMHESLYPAVGKRLTYVLNIAARAMTKHALNVHAGHDDYHAVDDTGFFQLFAKNPQEIADLNLIRKPDLSVVDADVCGISNGPRGPGETTSPKLLLAGTDPLAIDVFASNLIGIEPSSIYTFTAASELGFGNIDLDTLKVLSL